MVYLLLSLIGTNFDKTNYNDNAYVYQSPQSCLCILRNTATKTKPLTT